MTTRTPPPDGGQRRSPEDVDVRPVGAPRIASWGVSRARHGQAIIDTPWRSPHESPPHWRAPCASPNGVRRAGRRHGRGVRPRAPRARRRRRPPRTATAAPACGHDVRLDGVRHLAGLDRARRCRRPPTPRAPTSAWCSAAPPTAQLHGVQYYAAGVNRLATTGAVWNAAGRRIATISFPATSSDGWKTATLELAGADPRRPEVHRLLPRAQRPLRRRVRRRSTPAGPCPARA